MRSTRAPLLAAVLLAACASEVNLQSTPDAGELPDAGAPMVDGGSPDAARVRPSEARCTSGCDVVEVAAGRAHTCALRENGDVLCWGGNRWGELGDGLPRHASCTNRGDIEETDCSATVVRSRASDVNGLGTRGGFSSSAIASDGTALAWGIDLVSRPGLPTTEHPRYEPVALEASEPIVDVSAGTAHACVATASGRALCRGLAFAGQLGDGTHEDRDALVEVVGIDDVLDVEIGARGAFSCASTRSGVFCWGDGSSGQLGDGVASHDACYGDLGTFDCALAPVRAAGLGEVVALTAGARHACAIDPTGNVFCWGDNAQGQLGVESVTSSSTPLLVTAASPAVAISAGAAFTCAVSATGSVLCWGVDGRGQLGDGEGGRAVDCVDASERSRCSAVPGPVLSFEHAVGVSAGAAHACAWTSDGTVACWGENDQRQLGDGSREARHAPVDVPLEDV